MKLSNLQRGKLRSLAAASTELAAQLAGLRLLRDGKMTFSNELSAKLRNYETEMTTAGYKDVVSLEGKISALRGELAGVKASIEKLNTLMARANVDQTGCGAFIEKVLEFSGEDHEDFPKSDIYPAMGVRA